MFFFGLGLATNRGTERQLRRNSVIKFIVECKNDGKKESECVTKWSQLLVRLDGIFACSGVFPRCEQGANTQGMTASAAVAKQTLLIAAASSRVAPLSAAPSARTAAAGTDGAN
jgi:hypothetical protein